MKYGNIIYFRYLNTIGGIETWFYNLATLYNDLDIVVVVNSGSLPQIKRLSRKVRVIQWDGKSTFECENLFVNFNLNILPYVKADKVYCTLHGDYLDMVNRKQLNKENLPIDPRIDQYIAITKQVRDSWHELTGLNAIVCYNPVLVPKKHKTIRICSAQRMTAEKGKDRIKLLAETLNFVCRKTGNRWLWDIYTDNTNAIHNENITYKTPRLDIAEYLNGYDWFVALSDNEGYCYSVVESLMNGVPCVVTDLPVFKELELNESNSLKLNLNMDNILDVAVHMFDKKQSFEYQPPKDNWRFLFADKKSTYDYKEVNKMLHKVVALNTYSKLKVKDAELDKILPEGFQFEVDEARLKVLLGDNSYKTAFVKLVEESTEVLEEPKAEVEEPVEKPKRTKKAKK